jgi:hypothetical protein
MYVDNVSSSKSSIVYSFLTLVRPVFTSVHPKWTIIGYNSYHEIFEKEWHPLLIWVATQDNTEAHPLRIDLSLALPKWTTIGYGPYHETVLFSLHLCRYNTTPKGKLASGAPPTGSPQKWSRDARWRV